jgi:hypothetical protein
MSRNTGDESILPVLEAGDYWKDRCLLQNKSIFSDENLWTKENFKNLREHFEGNPLTGDRDFLEKLKEQLINAPKPIVKLAAELLWFYMLFPHRGNYAPETKEEQVRLIWSWAGEKISNEKYLKKEYLSGVGGVGVAYLANRYDQLRFLLLFFNEWKALSDGQRADIFNTDQPWDFASWIDDLPNSSKRPVRNAILYFACPEKIEPIISNDHRRLIASSFKGRLDSSQQVSADATLLELDKAIYEIRSSFEKELNSKDISFYRSPIEEQWSKISMKNIRRSIASAVEKTLEPYGLELRQCGSKKVNLEACNQELNSKSGFWKNPTSATNKPLRWIVHLDITGNKPIASLANENGQVITGARKIAFANNSQQKSGAITIRIVPAIKVAEESYIFYEDWEWVLLFCFYPALPQGSSGQLIDDFNPESGKMIYMEKEQAYIFAALITLNVEDSQFVKNIDGVTKQVNYQDATLALADFIKVSPADIEEVGANNG